MASIRQLASGHWQVQVRLKGRKATETFVRHDHAREWATEAERQVDRGHAPSGRRVRNAKTFGALIDLHIDDMKEVGNPYQGLRGMPAQHQLWRVGGTVEKLDVRFWAPLSQVAQPLSVNLF